MGEEKKEDKDRESSTKEGEGEATAAPGEEEKAEEKREASVEMVEEKEKVMATKNKDLLLGASYFDLSHCGYIERKVLKKLQMQPTLIIRIWLLWPEGLRDSSPLP